MKVVDAHVMELSSEANARFAIGHNRYRSHERNS